MAKGGRMKGKTQVFRRLSPPRLFCAGRSPLWKYELEEKEVIQAQAERSRHASETAIQTFTSPTPLIAPRR
jgi:hypothetical protein